MWSTVVIAGILLGIAQGIFWVLPEVSVSPEFPLKNDPFSAPFIVLNSGQFAIHNVETSCAINKVVNISSNSEQSNNFNSNYMPMLAQLESGEKTTIGCGELVMYSSTPISYADVTLVITYRPSFVWWISRTKRVRFQTNYNPVGHLQ